MTRICRCCRHRLTGDKCAKRYNIDFVSGRKIYWDCYHIRRGKEYCEDYEEKPSRRGYRKPDVEALVYNSLHYLSAVMAAVCVIVMFAALIVFAHKAA